LRTGKSILRRILVAILWIWSLLELGTRSKMERRCQISRVRKKINRSGPEK